MNENPSQPPALAEFLTRIQSPDDRISGPAWQSAQEHGAAAIKPLAGVMGSEEFEIARNAKRALYRITRYAGRPGAASEAKAAERELIAALQDPRPRVRREVLWMLSEIGSDRAVRPMAACLTDPEVREDARAALMRLPGSKATAALSASFHAADDTFKYALADALRKRGVQVEGYPSQKLTPSKPTTVKQLAASH